MIVLSWRCVLESAPLCAVVARFPISHALRTPMLDARSFRWLIARTARSFIWLFCCPVHRSRGLECPEERDYFPYVSISLPIRSLCSDPLRQSPDLIVVG
jgi:hypothetical protein